MVTRADRHWEIGFPTQTSDFPMNNTLSLLTACCLLRGEQGVHQSVGQPVLVLLWRPPTLRHQHAVHIPAGKHPEDIARGFVAKPRAKTSRLAKEVDHAF